MNSATKTIFAVLSAILAFSAGAVAEERHDDHEALRNILKKGAEALNTRNFDAISPLLHKQFTVVTVDNRKLTTLQDFRNYWNGLFSGDKPLLKKIEAKPIADDLTHFLDENVGVVHGTSDDVYHFQDGDVRTMKTRWTAVVAKEDGAWKLVKLHSSVNLLDNPLLEAATNAAKRVAMIGAGIGILIGGLAGFLIGRRRSA